MWSHVNQPERPHDCLRHPIDARKDEVVGRKKRPRRVGAFSRATALRNKVR
jgi:hypothetical protein